MRKNKDGQSVLQKIYEMCQNITIQSYHITVKMKLQKVFLVYVKQENENE